jgi:hypothetical protein
VGDIDTAMPLPLFFKADWETLFTRKRTFLELLKTGVSI